MEASDKFSWHQVLDEKVLTQDQAAELTGFSSRTIERWRLDGDLAYLRVGRQVRILGEDLADFLDDRTQHVPSVSAGSPNGMRKRARQAHDNR